jgi:hypothetical protein
MRTLALRSSGTELLVSDRAAHRVVFRFGERPAAARLTPAEPVKASLLRRASEIGYDTSMLRVT